MSLPTPTGLAPEDYLRLRLPSDPQIAPDGAFVAYVRTRADAQHDAWVADVCAVDLASNEPVELGSGQQPRWSPDGTVLVFARHDGPSTVLMRWRRGSSPASAEPIATLDGAVEGLSWSPDGGTLAFVAFVAQPAEAPAQPPPSWQSLRTPHWGPEPVCTEHLLRRAEGVDDELPDGRHHVFLLDLGSGALRQLTTGPWDHGGPLTRVTKLSLAGRISWTPDGRFIVMSMQRPTPPEDRAPGPLDPEATIASDVHEIRVDDGAVRRLTRFGGPVCGAAVSPDGRWIAFVGFRNRRRSFHTNVVHVMPREGGEIRALPHPAALEIHQDLQWRPDSQALLALTTDHGDGCLVSVDLAGRWSVLCREVGGSAASGYVLWNKSFSVARDGRIACLAGSATLTDEVAVLTPGDAALRPVTNESDWLRPREVARAEPLWVGTRLPLQGWLLRPARAAAHEKLPLVVWLHGGPFLAWGPHFAMAPQLWAARGYAVLMLNPRGSLGYGEAFTDRLHHDFPGADDLLLVDAVDEVVARGGLDADRVFVCGESGGGVLTSWLVGHSHRFRAAAVVYGAMDWSASVLTIDRPDYYPYYWLPAPPWEPGMHEHYWKRSPLSRVAHVETPTLVLCGDRDWRTPFSQSEMYFTALKLRGVDTALVRFPGANHGLEGHPSHWMALVDHVDRWFRRHA